MCYMYTYFYVIFMTSSSIIADLRAFVHKARKGQAVLSDMQVNVLQRFKTHGCTFMLFYNMTKGITFSFAFPA